MKEVSEVIVLADKFVLVQHVQLLACGWLALADDAGEAGEVKDLAPCTPHQVLWRYTLATSSALSAKPSVNITIHSIKAYTKRKRNNLNTIVRG